jgi:hypothetical protein
VERKKILRRAALIGLTVLGVALVVALFAHGVFLKADARRRRAQDEELARAAREHQAALDEMAQQIKSLPVDPQVIGRIQTTHFQNRRDRALYVWATANDGRFLFGVPEDAFARLNTVYDQNQQAILQDNHFASRDQFLRTFLHEPRRLGPIRPADAEDRTPRQREEEWWRYYDPEPGYYERVRRPLFLSAPIQDASGATVGNLNLKLVEAAERASGAWDASDWRGLSETGLGVAVMALLWLWFLIPSWVYIDAQERHMPRPLLWALLTVVGNVVGLLVYLISRPVGPKDLQCPRCAKALNGSKAGCPYCGADLSAAFCPQCQYPLKPDWAFCPSCRSAVPKTNAPSHEAEKS